MSRRVGKTIEVNIGSPEQVSPTEWKCPIRVATSADEVRNDVRGMDAFQALSLALEAIPLLLKNKLPDAYWHEAGDNGFARVVPVAFGAEFFKKIDRMIDAEAEFFADMAKSGKFRMRLPSKP
jgi:hypothetical protein